MQSVQCIPAQPLVALYRTVPYRTKLEGCPSRQYAHTQLCTPDTEGCPAPAVISMTHVPRRYSYMYSTVIIGIEDIIRSYYCRRPCALNSPELTLSIPISSRARDQQTCHVEYTLALIPLYMVAGPTSHIHVLGCTYIHTCTNPTCLVSKLLKFFSSEARLPGPQPRAHATPRHPGQGKTRISSSLVIRAVMSARTYSYTFCRRS
ncbi:hypothetical protein V8C40DRAFT_208912 [Trichoderma camerunense]